MAKHDMCDTAAFSRQGDITDYDVTVLFHYYSIHIFFPICLFVHRTPAAMFSTVKTETFVRIYAYT